MSLIPSRFLDTVVAIGRTQPDSTVRYTASGFVYQVPVEVSAKGEKLYASFVVTNRHVIEGAGDLYTRQNHPSGANVVGSSTENEWTFHPD